MKPTVELWVYHLTSFMAIGLFSGDKDLTSPKIIDYWLCKNKILDITEWKIIIGSDGLQEVTIRAPIHLH